MRIDILIYYYIAYVHVLDELGDRAKQGGGETLVDELYKNDVELLVVELGVQVLIDEDEDPVVYHEDIFLSEVGLEVVCVSVFREVVPETAHPMSQDEVDHQESDHSPDYGSFHVVQKFQDLP